MNLQENLPTLLLMISWALLWGIGGIWLVRAAFRLEQGETFVVGLSVGWIAENWLANLLVRFLPIPGAFWAASGLIFAAGLASALIFGEHSLRPGKIPLVQGLLLAFITLVFFNISRGMAIFDDFAHLPTVSIMATGDIPPHFSLDPNVVYGYHYFLLLFQAQVMRIAGLAPWTALDVGRALAFGCAVMLAGLFTLRVTRSRAAAALGGMVLAFGAGTRWLLLFIPRPVLNWISASIDMLGSGDASGSTLANAMQNAWAIEGVGPIPFPFAFANGVYSPGVINGHAANGLTPFVIIMVLLLTFHRWRGWLAAAISVVLISVWGLLGESELIGILASWGIVTLAYMLAAKTWRLPRSLWAWLAVIAAGCAIAFLEGGAWTDLLVKMVERLSGKEAASYQTIGFTLSAPALVSSHLGILPLYDPRALLVALVELGPFVLVFPLLAVWGWKAFRQERWYEAATAATALVMLLTLFVQFTGSTGVRNTPRLYVFLPILAVLAAPLTWLWAQRRSATVRLALAVLGVVTMLGGVVMFGIELIAGQHPVYSYYLTAIDARMHDQYWDRLEPGALVFDSNKSRAAAIFGRANNSSTTWYQVKPEWEALRKAPDPRVLRAAGYRYLYLDNLYWSQMDPAYQQKLGDPCVQQLNEFVDAENNFRRLLDLETCR